MAKSNPIGTGTSNLSLNAPKDWAVEIGRAAFAAGVSVGEFLRRAVEQGIALNDPARAVRLRQIRKQYYGATLLAVFCAGLLATWLNHDEFSLRRTARNNRPASRRTEQVCPDLEIEEEGAA